MHQGPRQPLAGGREEVLSIIVDPSNMLYFFVLCGGLGGFGTEPAQEQIAYVLLLLQCRVGKEKGLC